MKRFVCSGHDGSIVHTFVFHGLNDGKPRKRHILLERHTGPCGCSYCRKDENCFGRFFGTKLKGPGWRVIMLATPWSRWYLRFTSARGWQS